MKNRIIISIIAAATISACLMAAGCQKKPEAPVRTGDTSTIETEPEKQHFIFTQHEDTTPENKLTTDGVVIITNTCEEVSFVPYNRSDSGASKSMNAVLDKAFKNHRQIASDMVEDAQEYITDGVIDPEVLPWETRIDYSCKRNDGKAISVIETADFYSAGKLKGTTVRTYNFKPLTGEQITNVFFSDNASRDEMDDYIYNKLLEKYGEDSGITYTMPTLVSMVDEALSSWYFTETGVKIIYNPGSIAPIENGTFELELTKQELPEFAHEYFNK